MHHQNSRWRSDDGATTGERRSGDDEQQLHCNCNSNSTGGAAARRAQQAHNKVTRYATGGCFWIGVSGEGGGKGGGGGGSNSACSA